MGVNYILKQIKEMAAVLHRLFYFDTFNYDKLVFCQGELNKINSNFVA